MKETRRSLLTSATALLLCFVMLAGSTFAWFTDIASSSDNIIQSGNLDAEMHWSNDLLPADSTEWQNADGVPVFTYNNWEPGYTEVKYIKVTNNGNLNFKWRLTIEANGTMTDLADVIDVYYVNPVSTELTSLDGLSSVGTVKEVISGRTENTGRLTPGTTAILAIAFHMDELAGNEYQNKSLCDGGFSLKLLATQDVGESDSFGDDYDAESQWPENIVLGNTASAEVKTDENNLLTADATMTSADGKISAFVPQGTKLVAGANKVTLNVANVQDSNANITLSENEAALSIDVHINGVAEDNSSVMAISVKELLPTGLNMGNYRFYHVEDGNTVEMTLLANGATPVHNNYEYDPATGDVILHLASFSEVALVAEPAKWEGKFDYSWYTNAVAPVDGEAVTEYKIANADQLAAFGAIVGGMNGQTRDSFEGKIVKLVSDINLGDKDNENGSLIFHPIGYYYTDDKNKDGTTGDYYSTVYSFEGTFDGNGHTIANFYQNTWEIKGDYDGNYYSDAMGLFGYVVKGTIKNLTVSNFSSDGEFTPTGVIAAYAAGDAKFENIAITDCNPRVYNTGNGGIIGIAGDTSKNNDDHITLTNITVDNSNKITALWGSWDVACGGLVGMYRGNVDGSGNATGDTIMFNNCHVSAQIDVYNDVCANYQYYAYRYSGMMIGSVRHNTTNNEGRTIPNMTGISASGCTVHFGTWNDYYYCEIVDNTTASYTHDYQMSRLTEIKAIDGTTITYLDGTTGTVPASGRANYVIVDYTKGHGTENATCYHFKNGEVWTHDMGGIQTGIDENGDGQDDLKEDKQHLYLEFNNLVTGYGWGVSTKAVDDVSGVEILDKTMDGSSVEKFTGKLDTLTTDRVYTLDEIFTYIEDCGVKVVDGALSVTITNLDENGNVIATFKRGEKWNEGTISFVNTGNIAITIQDYYFCQATTINATVTGRVDEEKFDVVMNNGDFLHRVGNVGTVALDKLFAAKDGVTVGTVSVTVEAVNGTSASGTYSNNAIQFSGTGVVKVTIKDDDKYCTPTTLYLEVVDATNVTGLGGEISGNVVLLNDCNLNSLTVSGRNTVFGNGFTATYSGNGQYLNNGLKQGVITVSDNGTLDNLRVKASIYPEAYVYSDEAKNGPYEVGTNGNRYYYQLSAVKASGNATISNCYIYGARTNIFVDTGDVTIKDTILECGTLANIQIQSNASHTITLENVTTIQHQVNATVGDTTKVMLGAGVVIGPDTTENPKIVLNGDFKQYNWVTSADKAAISNSTAKSIIQTALDASQFNHEINGKTASNLGIIFLNEYDTNIENNTGLPYKLQGVSMAPENGQVYSLQGATESQIYSDYANANKSTVNGLYKPQFKYDSTLGSQYIEKDSGDEHFYREGDTIYVLFPSGDTKEIDLVAIVNIVKYSGQNLNLVVTVKDENGNAVTVTNGKVNLSDAGNYTVTYTVTDTLFYDKDGNTVTGEETYSWDVTVSVSLKDTKIPDARFEFDSTKQKMGYYKPSWGDVKQYIPFLAGLKIYDYNGKEAYLRFDGDNDYNKVASITVTNKYSGNDALVEVKLTDGGTITLQLLARADSGGGSDYTGAIKTKNNVIYFVNNGGTSNKDTTTTAAYWYVDYYKFTGNNGVTIQSGQQTFNSSGSSASTPSGSFSTKINYTVTYDANGGNCGQTVGYATSAATAVTLATPTRSGYIFAGWYTAANGGTRVGGAGESYTPSANITLYAQWGKPCDVTYNANGGTCGTASETYTGTELVLPNAERNGYTFLGWYTAVNGGTRVGGAGDKYNPSGEITLYAHWQLPITVTYNANGGSCGISSELYDGDLTLPSASLTGYTFLGWYTAASGGTKIGDAGASYIPSANVTLYAQWKINSYTINISTTNATVTINGKDYTSGSVNIDYGALVTVSVTYSKDNSRTMSIKGVDGTTYTSPFNMPAQNVNISASSSGCFAEGSLVTLADGTQKPIEEITFEDQILAWDFNTGTYVATVASLIDRYEASQQNVINLKFSDGTVVRMVIDHGFFDVDANKFVFLNEENVSSYVGHTFVKTSANGTYENVELVGYEITVENVAYYAIQTAIYNNCIVDGMFTLTAPPEMIKYSDWFNYFEIGEGMKYDEEKMQADIEQYGLYTYEDFADYVTYEQFIAFNGPYLKVLVGRGVVTYDQIIELISMYVNPEN